MPEQDDIDEVRRPEREVAWRPCAANEDIEGLLDSLKKYEDEYYSRNHDFQYGFKDGMKKAQQLIEHWWSTLGE
ncbi:MAG: hypothetical protein ACO28P_10705 [Ilumatobacteraceae bacterium]